MGAIRQTRRRWNFGTRRTTPTDSMFPEIYFRQVRLCQLQFRECRLAQSGPTKAGRANLFFQAQSSQTPREFCQVHLMTRMKAALDRFEKRIDSLAIIDH